MLGLRLMGKKGLDAYQCSHGFTLRLGPGVRRLSLCIQSALVANANAMFVMPYAVGSDLFQRTSRFDGTVAAHHIVIPYAVLPSTFLVPAVNVGSTALLPGRDTRAMKDY